MRIKVSGEQRSKGYKARGSPGHVPEVVPSRVQTV